MNTIQIGDDIRARKNDSGYWEIKHPGREGKMTRFYSTGIQGDARTLRKHIKEQKVEDIIAIGKRGALTDKVLAQFQTGSSKPMCLPQVIDGWLNWLRRIGERPETINQYHTYCRLWAREAKLENVPVSKIGVDLIFPFVNPPASTIKKTTRQARLHSVRSLYRYMVAQGYCNGNPASIVEVSMDMLTHEQKESRPVHSYTKAQVKQLVSYIDSEILHIDGLIRTGKTDPRIRKPMSRLGWMHFWRFAVIAAWETGLRQGDICNLEWQSLATEGSLIVWTRKRSKRIAVPLDRFSPWLQEAIAKIPCDDLQYCFPEVREVHQNNRSTVSSYFIRLCEDAGIEGRTFHGLRNTCIRRMKSEGWTLEDIGEVVAHSSASTTEGYL